jgi:hypothetical protein
MVDEYVVGEHPIQKEVVMSNFSDSVWRLNTGLKCSARAPLAINMNQLAETNKAIILLALQSGVRLPELVIMVDRLKNKRFYRLCPY